MSSVCAPAERAVVAERAGRNASVLPLRLESLTYEIGAKRLIDGISLAFTRGPRTVILGPNGAGKSLLLRLCHGLIAPTSGRVAWAAADRRALARRQAMVFQSPVLLRRSTAANIDYALRLRGLGAGERRALVGEALALADLTGLAQQPARTLSGGEQQRLAIARAWALRPEVLFLDEPTARLDPTATRSIEALIQAVHAGGAKVIMTTHDIGQARRLADEIVFLHRGQVREHAPAARFFAGPSTPEAAHFLEGGLLC